jgi:heptosyltransferase I
VPAPAISAVRDNPSPLSFRRLLIVRLGAMGDIVHTLPAVAALRTAFPEATIGWVVEDRWAELLSTISAAHSGAGTPERPLVDNIHTVNTKVWRTSMTSAQTWKQIAAALRQVRSARYEIAIDFQGAIRSALIARAAGAGAIYGFAQPRETAARTLYSRRTFARGTHIVEQNLSLAEDVTGRVLQMPKAILPRDQDAERECERRLQQDRIGKFALLNPGAGWGAKRWPPERYGQVARQLGRSGLKALINFGPGEQDLAKAVERASGGNAIELSCSITQLIALARRASLFVGGDTGPMHLAAAFGVPVVALFGPTDPARNGPFGTRSVVLRSPTSLTSHKRRPRPEPGLLEITADQVIAATRQLLENSRG